VELGAPSARVAAAVRALAGRLAAARDALAPATGAAEVTAGADALAVGVPAAVLRDVRRLSPGRSTAVALGVLAQLVSRGVPPARAAAVVTSLVRGGARASQLAALDAAVQADVAAGIPAGQALDGRARELADAGRLSPGPLVAPLSPAPTRWPTWSTRGPTSARPASRPRRAARAHQHAAPAASTAAAAAVAATGAARGRPAARTCAAGHERAGGRTGGGGRDTGRPARRRGPVARPPGGPGWGDASGRPVPDGQRRGGRAGGALRVLH
jgi:hypothetical protein